MLAPYAGAVRGGVGALAPRSAFYVLLSLLAADDGFDEVDDFFKRPPLRH